MTSVPAPPVRGFVHHRAVFALFFLYALILGAILSRLYDMQARMGVEEGALGLGLLGMPLGTQIALLFGAPLVQRLGTRGIVRSGLGVLAAGQIIAATSTGVPLFFVALTLAGLGIGLVEVVLNLEADRGEAELGRRIMSRAHSFWSFGFFASGLAGAAAAGLAMPVWLHLVIVDAVALAAMTLILRDFRPARSRLVESAPAARFVAPDRFILVLLAITLSAMMLEGAANDWSVIYMRDTFSPGAFVAGLALAVAAGSQALMRYFADPVVDRFGPRAVARNLLIVLGIGVVLVTFAPSPWVAFVGFAAIGIGNGTLFPLAVSAAAQRDDRPSAESVAALAQTSFFVFLVTPPLLGFLGEHISLRACFAIGLPLVVLSLAFVNRLAPR
ncbi:MFS transporter [Wenxinia marina]|nr:MFS transporter [Wenxinia marina]GGL70680.1 MFS transporter [Wenxinia marina]